MPNPIDTASASTVAILAQFSYENPETVHRFAAWESDVTLEGNVFSSMPTLQAKLPKQDGTVQSQVAEITMEEVALLTAMRSTFPPVTVTLWEMDPSDPSSAYVLYKGLVSHNDYNYNGNPKVVKVHVAGPKRMLETSVSMRIGRFCNAVALGKGTCQYDREGNKETHALTSRQGNKITLTSPLDNASPGHWKFGSVRYRGFEVGIHSLVSSTVLWTVKPVPLHWVGQEIDVLPGCDKTPTRCVELGQQENFTGIGVKIPNRDPRTTPE